MIDRPETVAPGSRNPVADLLRSCVQCGLCLPHCATWLASGNETMSPRGRLILLETILDETAGYAPPEYLDAFASCIGCRACETACPSGVPFSLMEKGLDAASGASSVSGQPLVPGWVERRLDSPRFMAAVASLGRIGRRTMRVLGGRSWRRRLDGGPRVWRSVGRMLGSLPRTVETDATLVAQLKSLAAVDAGGIDARPADAAPVGPPLLLFEGCANRGLLPATSRRLRDLLRWAGYRFASAETAECCGALAAHSGRPGRAATLKSRNDRALAGQEAEGGLIVVEAAGCSHHLKQDSPSAGAVRDVIEFLAEASLPELAPVDLTVAVHDPCHALHGQGISEAPRRLLRRIPGLRVREPHEADVCCGSGGAWGLRYPDMSAELGRRKATFLAGTGADLIVTNNPGCLGQIADGLSFVDDGPPILPLTDLVWFAALSARG